MPTTQARELSKEGTIAELRREIDKARKAGKFERLKELRRVSVEVELADLSASDTYQKLPDDSAEHAQRRTAAFETLLQALYKANRVLHPAYFGWQPATPQSISILKQTAATQE